MEEISGTKSHKLILNNRRTGSFTGILDVLSFDDTFGDGAGHA